MHSDTTPALLAAPPRASTRSHHHAAPWDLARLRDLAVILFLAPAVLLVGAVIAAAIFLDSPGPIFYRQTRVGYRGRRFEMLKFRKMKPHRDALMLTQADDHRFTPIGCFLTRTNLDELPQVWNVLRGDMRLVGPRPELECFVAAHEQAYEEILTVVPGLTGPAQVKFVHEGSLLASSEDPARFYLDELMPQKIRIDLEYVRTRSFRGDLRLLARTFTVPARRSGLRPPSRIRHLMPAAACLMSLAIAFALATLTAT